MKIVIAVLEIWLVVAVWQPALAGYLPTEEQLGQIRSLLPHAIRLERGGVVHQVGYGRRGVVVYYAELFPGHTLRKREEWQTLPGGYEHLVEWWFYPDKAFRVERIYRPDGVEIYDSRAERWATDAEIVIEKSEDTSYRLTRLQM